MDFEDFIKESAEDLYEQAPCGYLSFLLDGTIVKVNQTLLNWLGLTREDVLKNLKFKELLTPASQQDYETQFTPSLKRQGVVKNMNLEFITALGISLQALVTATQVKDQQNVPQVNRTTIFNISDQKKYEEELITARNQAEEAAKIKTEFISTLTHEIRSPLSAIIGITNLLINNKSPEQTAEFLEVLKYSSESLLNLINDILDLSKIEAGHAELNPKSFNLRQMVKKIALIQNIKAAEKGIEVEVVLDEKLPSWVIGDEIKIGQVLTNLVNNAVKFTAKGGVKLQLELLRDDKQFYDILFRVTDTGIGIPAERLDTIFEEFTQAGADTSRQYGGTGLGLTISKRILDLYGSQILVESTPGTGTEFKFTLNLKRAAPVTVPNPEKQNPKEENLLKGVKLLVVEDSKVNSMVIEQYLKSWGVEFELARNGLQAISKITHGDFDLILMDLQMPVLDGYEATRWIRSLPQPKYRNLPIIALSAVAKEESEPDLQKAGLTDFLNKPFQPEDLFSKIALYRNINKEPAAK